MNQQLLQVQGKDDMLLRLKVLCDSRILCAALYSCGLHTGC